MQYRKKIGLAVLGAVALLGGVTLVQAEPEQKPKASSSQSLGIGALGRIEPRSRVIRVSHDAGPEGARIGMLNVDEGSQVKAGAVLAVFSDIERRRAELAVAQADLGALRARRGFVDVELDDAETDFRRKSVLVKSSAVSVTAYDAAKVRQSRARAEQEGLIAQIASAEAGLQYKTEQLKQSTLLAPIDGTVIKVHARSGERVPNEGVLEMADLTHMDVVAEIYEMDIPRVKEKQKVEIIIPGMQKHYEGEVREIGYQVRKNDLSNTDPLADRDNRIIEVRVTLLGEAVTDLRHQIYRQVQVQIQP